MDHPDGPGLTTEQMERAWWIGGPDRWTGPDRDDQARQMEQMERAKGGSAGHKWNRWSGVKGGSAGLNGTDGAGERWIGVPTDGPDGAGVKGGSAGPTDDQMERA
jgi:hypothetical protein